MQKRFLLNFEMTEVSLRFQTYSPCEQLQWRAWQWSIHRSNKIKRSSSKNSNRSFTCWCTNTTGNIFKIRLHRCWWPVDVGDFRLVTIFGCLWQNFDIGDIFWMLVTKSAKIVTNISKLSPTYFVYNICRQHRCSRAIIQNVV